MFDREDMFCLHGLYLLVNDNRNWVGRRPIRYDSVNFALDPKTTSGFSDNSVVFCHVELSAFGSRPNVSNLVKYQDSP
jgi:hypothetical protein